MSGSLTLTGSGYSLVVSWIKPATISCLCSVQWGFVAWLVCCVASLVSLVQSMGVASVLLYLPLHGSQNVHNSNILL
ncbi:hypothetical protein E2C01_006617 [Portunus trituberculatus]|uniref:Uncharacterized protein n=1 Tax=Portunus trituberculatus TaxID=210409 RepID=A0A5B7CXA9_PORTR|nr:hypothetical protein [Portunus trituberculatus]